MENQTHYMEIVWAALRSGLYLTAINSYLTTPEVAYIIDDCDARLVRHVSRAKAERRRRDRSRRHTWVERWLMVDGVATDDSRCRRGRPLRGCESATQPERRPIADESPGTSMLYSSGTTGRPKGIKRPLPDRRHRGDRSRAYDRVHVPTLFGYRRDMVYLSPAPMYHAAPLAFVAPVHRLGGTLVIMERFDAGRRRCGPSRRYASPTPMVVPTMFVRMLKLDEDVRNSPRPVAVSRSPSTPPRRARFR